MSGNFWPLFKKTVLLSIGAFLFLALIAWFCSGWSLMETFIQLTNPQLHGENAMSGADFGGMVTLPYAEWLIIPLVNLFGLFVLNGVILTLLVNWVTNRRERVEKGQARYEYIYTKKFAVILGGHPVVANLARDLVKNGRNDYILIQTQRSPEKVRSEITAVINERDITDRIIIYAGSRTSEHELAELHLHRASEIYIIGEPFYIDGSDHDAINMHTWQLINDETPRDYGIPIPCHVMFEHQSTFKAFQFTDLNTEQERPFQFIPFSLYENWAQQLLIPSLGSAPSTYIPLDGLTGIPYESSQRVHLIIIGMSKMGLALAMEAAHIAHYPNFNNPQGAHPRTLITFIDCQARQEMTRLMQRFRELFQLARWRYVKAPDTLIPSSDNSWKLYTSLSSMEKTAESSQYPWIDFINDSKANSPYSGGYLGNNLIDIDFEFIEGDVALPSVQQYLKEACEDNSEDIKHPGSKTTIAVCLPTSSSALSAALHFNDSVYEGVQQIWVYQSESGALIDSIRQGMTGDAVSKFAKLRAFGMLGQCDYLVRIHDSLPKIVAFAYKCMDKGSSLVQEFDRLSMEELNKEINSHWISISSEGGKSAITQQWSNIYCANSFDTKLRCLNVDLSQCKLIEDEQLTDILAKVEHNRWVIEQLLLGIRPPSKEFAHSLPIEDKQIRKLLKSQNTHPDLISNEKLGTTQAYDRNIVQIMPLALHIAMRLQTL